MRARAFNNISVDYENGTITKSSSNILKIKNEINYYLDLPPKISKFFPKLLGFKKDFTAYTIEYIPCKSLSELILEKKIKRKEAKSVFKKLFNILDEIHYFKPVDHYPDTDVSNFYISKTLERLEQLQKNDYFNQLMKIPYLKINNKIYKNFFMLQFNFVEVIENFIRQKKPVTAIHGDFCLSNILYCPDSKKITLIDPRGSFGHPGIYGHPSYDYAKLLHCLHGKYDYIISNHYKLKEIDQNTFSLEVYSSRLIQDLHQFCCTLLLEKNINLEFLYLIESTLFLSMIALHYEDFERQKAFFLTGLMNLNSILEGNYANLH